MSDSIWGSVIIAGAISVSIIISTLLANRTNNRQREAYDLQKEAYNKEQRAIEIELVFKLNKEIYDSERGKKIVEMAKDPNRIIVDIARPRGITTDLPHREVENFLNDVEHIFELKDYGILTDYIFQEAFSWMLDRITENKSITDFIEAKQKRPYA